MRDSINNGDRQDLTSGDRSSVSVTDRMPTELPARPSFWISGIDEPSPPSVGEGDESPTNLVGYSDVSVDQTTADEQPLWRGDYWEFEGSDDSWPNSNISISTDALTVVVVAQRNDSGISSRGILEMAGPNGEFVQLREENTGRTSFEVTDRFGTNGSLSSAGVSIFDNKYILVGRVDFGADLYEMDVLDGGGNTLDRDGSPGFSGRSTLSSLRIGRAGGTGDLQADLHHISIFEESLTANQIEGYLIPWLKDRHGIGETSSEPLSTRLPASLPANPDLWIDASTEPAAPGDGQGDERPTNRAVGDAKLYQTATTGEPIWHDEGYWELAGDDYWRSKAPNARWTYLSSGEPMTLEFIIRYDLAIEEVMTLIGTKRGFAPDGMIFQIDNRDGDGAIRYNGTASTATSPDGAMPDDTEWHRVALRNDGVNSTIWVDGTQITSNAIGAIDRTTPANELRVGADGQSLSQFQGDIRDVRLYRTALSDTYLGRT